jgi:NAD-dependent deacetylase
VIEAAAATLRTARSVCVLTGSGISAESGIPTFRDAQTGLWARFRPEQLASPDAFERDPRLVWQWYEWRRELVRKAEPNAGHRALVELAGRVPNFALITQNVDGLHQRAGSKGVIEYHGNILRDRCVSGGVCPATPRALRDGLPYCGQCGSLLRPDVVWFGEAIPADAEIAANRAARTCDVFVAIGTSAVVYPAAGLAAYARANGARIIEVNPNPTPLSEMADIVLAGAAGTVLPALVGAMHSA